MIEGLDLRARGVLLTLLFLCDDEGRCNIPIRKFARENGMSHQEIRTIISKLLSTHWITHLTTHSGTQGLTHLTLNVSAINNISKNINQHINQHIEQHNQQHIKTPADKPVSHTTKDLAITNAEDKERIDWKGFMDYFNNRVKGSKIPQVRVMTDARKRQIRSLMGKYSKKDLMKAIEVCIANPFLRGENERGWTVDIDWIYTEKHFVKIMEGNYEWKGNHDKTGDASGRSQGRGATIEGVAREILLSCQGRESG